jgi:hypothetical protein
MGVEVFFNEFIRDEAGLRHYFAALHDLARRVRFL